MKMEEKYIISIDQSTQGTKALLFDAEGQLLRRTDMPHRQIVNEKGWFRMTRKKSIEIHCVL